MSKYIIFILIFNVFCFVQNSDTYSVSDHKTVDNIILKRQIPPQPQPNVQAVNHIESKDKEDLNNPTVPKDAKPISKDVVNAESDSAKPTDTTKEHIKTENKQPAVNKEDKNTETAVNKHEESKKNSEVTVNDSTPDGNIKKVHGSNEHPGAMLRGFYVFLGLSIIIIIYFIIKAFRLRPGAPAPTTVRKYGVVGRRSDMEMLPLPLAEEEDDDTLFDMGSQGNR